MQQDAERQPGAEAEDGLQPNFPEHIARGFSVAVPEHTERRQLFCAFADVDIGNLIQDDHGQGACAGDNQQDDGVQTFQQPFIRRLCLCRPFNREHARLRQQRL